MKKNVTLKVISTQLNKNEEIKILINVLNDLCSYLESKFPSGFYVDDVAVWFKLKHPEIVIFKGDRGRNELKRKFPRKDILNVQNVCHHLSGHTKSVIEVLEPIKKKIDPFDWIGKMNYRLKRDWKKRTFESVAEVAGQLPRDAKNETNEDVPKFQEKIEESKHINTSKPSNGAELGLSGEYFILKYEIRKLKEIGQAELVGKVKHISVESNDTAGYDILSFDNNGNEIFIEVKTTTGEKKTAFFITENELNCSRKNPEKYRLYRVYNFNEGKGQGDVEIVQGSVNANYDLKPVTYIATKKS